MKYLYSVYLSMLGFLYFVFFLIFALIVSYFIPASKYNPWLQKILRFFFKIMRIPVKVEGAENIVPEKTYLYMANHVSLFDIPLIGGFVPGFVRGIEAKRQHRWPLYGWVMGRLGNIPIERDNIHRSISSIRKSEKTLKQGISMIILPEGHRTLDGKLRSFKKLPFFLAKQVESEIVPIGLSGLFHLKAKDSWHIRPTPLIIKFGKIIPVDTIRALAVADLRDLVREEIQKLIEMP